MADADAAAGASTATQPLALAPASWEEIAGRLAGRRLALFLDYDGTLTPIVARPELAVLPAAARDAVQRLAARGPVAVLSGRGREDVETMVGLPGLWYAGSHGFDIAGPLPPTDRGAGGIGGGDGGGGHPLRLEVGGAGTPERMERLAERLRRDLAGIAGTLVEPKRFSVAVHHRLADADDLPRIEAAVDRAAAAMPAEGGAGAPGLRKTGGKMVFELRPAIDWDKGRALLWLLDRLGLDGADVVPIYLGDDLTDEDAFAAVAARGGIPILVADPPRPSAAAFRLRNPAEVVELLDRLAALP